MIRTPILIVALASASVLAIPAQRDEAAPSPVRQLVLATADTLPYSSEDGTGIYDRLLRRAFDRLGISISMRHLPSERGLLEANRGRLDGEFARTAQVAAEYDNLIQVPAPLSVWDFVAITRPGTSAPTTFAALRDYHVAFINGWKIFETNVARYRSLTLVESEEQLFAMLLAEHVDVVLYGRGRAEEWLTRHHSTSLVVADEPLARQPMHLLLHRRHATLVPCISAEIARLREGDSHRSDPFAPGATR
jgi:polar amino acid transport system substrate-binding protein